MRVMQFGELRVRRQLKWTVVTHYLLLINIAGIHEKNVNCDQFKMVFYEISRLILIIESYSRNLQFIIH